MRVVIVTRNERGLASRFLRGDIPDSIKVTAVLHDLGAATSRATHMRVKARKLRRLGPTMIPVALLLRRAYARADEDDVPSLREFDIRVESVTSANAPAARTLLSELAPDLLLTLGSRFLGERTFSIPRLGAINVHHGSVPRYRGGPPIFWELADGESEVGYIVHQIDSGIDTGPIYATGSVPIERRASVPETIKATLPLLFERSLETLATVLADVAAGSAAMTPQPPTSGPPNTSPRLRDYRRASAALRESR